MKRKSFFNLARKIVVIIALIILFFIYKEITKPPLVIGDFPEKSLIQYSSEYNYRQSILDCGPYSVSAVMRVLLGKQVNSSEIVDQMTWQIPRMGYHPWGIEKALKQNGIQISKPDLDNLSDEERLSYLKTQISQNQPVILLGKQKGVQHYLTLLGYDDSKKEFYIYDSWHDKLKEGYTIDDNSELPGNRTLSDSELLEFWSGGGIMGFYKWYAIVNSV